MHKKYAMRCLASMTRNNTGVLAVGCYEKCCAEVLKILEFAKDEETMANTAKVVKNCLKDDKVRLFNFILDL